MRQVLFLLCFCSWTIAAIADINFIHCLGPIDLGGLDQIGFYRKSCILNENFLNRTHAWNFEKSVIRRTNFTSCGFEDKEDRKQTYEGSTWEDVTFKGCHFGSKQAGPQSVTSFTEASFHNVVFDGCVFHASAQMIFSSFSISTVTFRNCRFLGTVTLTKGTISRLSIEQSGFAPYVANSAWAGHAAFLFSEVDMSSLRIQRPVGGVFRIQASSVSDLLMIEGTAESLICHEKLEDNSQISFSATLSDAILVNVGFHDGIYCERGVLNGLELQDVKVGRSVDLNHSTIERLAVLNLTSLSENRTARFSLEEASIAGDRIKGVQDIYATFQRAVFHMGIYLEGVQLSTSLFILTDTIFSQERINEECCTIACAIKECKCDVSLEPVTGCPRGNSSVNVNVVDSCFPADSTVSVISSVSEPQDIFVKDLRHGHVVANVWGVDASEVFFFGHRTSSRLALFRVLKGYVIEKGREAEEFDLTISPGHLLPVAGHGEVAAGKVKINDILLTWNGKRARVTEIRSRVKKGMYAPTTLSGKMSVNGIQVSCYTDTFPPGIAHVSLAPLRALYISSQYGREFLTRIKLLDERSAGWIVAWVRRLMYNWHNIKAPSPKDDTLTQTVASHLRSRVA